jgi:SAM-dependent methyltransferase
VSGKDERDVFEALGVPLDAEGAARALGVAARRLRALLDVLVLDGALARSGAAERPLYVRAPSDIPPRPAPLPPGGWGALADAIRADRPVAAALEDAETLRRHHAHLVETAAAPARALSERFADVLRAGAFLDAGGGAGGYARVFLERHPASRATLADRAEVIALARPGLSAFEGRVDFLAADLIELAIPPVHRLALLANVLHLHPAAACARIVERAAAALEPGGALVVKDLRIEEDRRGPETSVLFALNMAVFTEGGDVHAPALVVEWLRAAGLEGVRVERLAGSPDSAVVWGTKPSADRG